MQKPLGLFVGDRERLWSELVETQITSDFLDRNLKLNWEVRWEQSTVKWRSSVTYKCHSSPYTVGRTLHNTNLCRITSSIQVQGRRINILKPLKWGNKVRRQRSRHLSSIVILSSVTEQCTTHYRLYYSQVIYNRYH